MTNFKQPVSMECTEEQYNRDLKQGLDRLGYALPEMKRWYINDCIVTNYANVPSYVCNMTIVNGSLDKGRHFITQYNPSLFLAIAGMREGEDVRVGEWVKWSGNNPCLGEVVGMYEDTLGINYQLSVNGNEGSHNTCNYRYIRKATLSELISHFAKQEKAMEHEFKFGDRIKAWNKSDEKHICFFVANVQGKILTVLNRWETEDILRLESVAITPYARCEKYTEPLKITRSEIKEKFNCDNFVIKD